MPDPLTTAASAITLTEKARALLRSTNAATLTRRPQRGLDLLPLDFRVDLVGTVPRVSVRAHLVNYSLARLEVVDGELLQLWVPNGQCLDRIPLRGTYCIRRKASTILSFDRPLLHGEPTAVDGPERQGQSELSVSLRIKHWWGWERTLTFFGCGYMNGYVGGLPPSN